MNRQIGQVCLPFNREKIDADVVMSFQSRLSDAANSSVPVVLPPCVCGHGEAIKRIYIFAKSSTIGIFQIPDTIERNLQAMASPSSTASTRSSSGDTAITTPSAMAANNIEPNHTSRAAFYLPPLNFTNPVYAANDANATFAVTVFIPSRPHSAYHIIVAVDEEIELFLDDITRILNLPLPRRPGRPIVSVHWANPGNLLVPKTRLSGNSLKPLLRLMKQRETGDMLIIEQS